MRNRIYGNGRVTLLNLEGELKSFSYGNPGCGEQIINMDLSCIAAGYVYNVKISNIHGSFK